MANESDTYKLIYFPCRGRGEIIRYLFAYANVAYHQQIIPFEDWPRVKPTTAFGHLPILEVREKSLCQCSAIARYLANEFGLSGKDSWHRACADMLVQSVVDLYDNLRPVVRALRAGDQELMATEWSKYSVNHLNPMLVRYESFLGDNQWFCENAVTYADIAIGEYLERVHFCYDCEIVQHYPRLNELMHRLHELPNIKEYVEQRPKYKF